MNTDWNERLTGLALLQRETDQRLQVATAMKQRFYEMYVKPYEDEVVALVQAQNHMEDSIRQDVMEYFNETGDKTPHESMIIRVKRRWMYDKDAALDYAVAEGLEQCLRQNLNVREFEKRLDVLGWTGAEKVNAPEVAISRLGALAIHADAESKGKQE